MENIHRLIILLKGTPGLNAKRSILRSERDNKLFQRVLTYTFDPRITFGIKKIPKYIQKGEFLTLNEALDELNRLVTRSITGNNAIDLLTSILESLSEDDAQVIEWVISKDFKAGFGISLVNDEMKPFSIYEVPYMGAVSYSPKRVSKILEKSIGISEVKMDGRYLNVIVRNGSVFMESRGGKPNPLMGCLEREALSLSKSLQMNEVVFNGELMVRDEKDRYVANGMISSFVSISQKAHDGHDISKEIEKFEKRYNMEFKELLEKISLVVWDFIPYENYLEKMWEKPRYERLIILRDGLEKIPENEKKFELIEYVYVKNETEAIQHFQEMLARGEEGTILKSYHGVWKDGKPTYQCKMKVEITSDLIITGFNYGTPGTKNENVISSLNVETSDGKLKTSPGGITESDMKFITENQEELLGKIVEVKSCGISQDSEGNYSLLHPVFLKIRDDKDKSDSLEDIIENDNMAKGLS